MAKTHIDPSMYAWINQKDGNRLGWESIKLLSEKWKKLLRLDLRSI